MKTRGKIMIGLATVVALFIVSYFEEGVLYRRVGDVDLVSGRLRTTTYFCGLRVRQEARGSRFSDIMAAYCGQPDAPAQWYPDTLVRSAKTIGCIKTGGKAMAACSGFAVALEMAPLSDEIKAQYVRKAQGHLQAGEFDSIRELARDQVLVSDGLAVPGNTRALE